MYFACPATVWAVAMSLLLAGPAMVHGGSSDAVEAAGRYRQSVEWCQSASMKIESRTELEGMPDKEPYVTVLTFDRDRNRVAWRGESFQLDAQGNPDVRRGIARQNVGTGKEMYYVNGEARQPPLGVLVVAKGYQEILSGYLEDLDLGAPLWGALPGVQHNSLADLLARADTKPLRMRDETVRGEACQAIEADTPYGKLTIWVAPKKGYQAVRWELVKGPEHLYDETSLAKLGLKTWTMTFDANQVDQIQGAFVVTNGVLTLKICESNGSVNVTRWRYGLSNVNLSPDFSSPAVFALNVPNGTRIDRSEVPGVRFIWHDGKPVAAVDGEAVSQIDATVDTFLAKAPVGAVDQVHSRPRGVSTREVSSLASPPSPWWPGYLLSACAVLAGCLAGSAYLWRRARRARR